MQRRNGIEGTQSEMVRGYGMRRARYRGKAKTRLQNWLTGAACNLRRLYRRMLWESNQATRQRGARGHCRRTRPAGCLNPGKHHDTGPKQAARGAPQRNRSRPGSPPHRASRRNVTRMALPPGPRPPFFSAINS